MNTEEIAFFYVVRDNSATNNHPTRKHWSYGAAEAEAVRLARIHPGERFVLVQARMIFTVPSPDVVRVRVSQDDVPF